MCPDQSIPESERGCFINYIGTIGTNCGLSQTKQDICSPYKKIKILLWKAMENNWTPWKKIYDQPREHIQKQRHYFAD